MPLAAAAKLAPNFSAHELGADQPEATDQVIANLKRVAEWLQAVRALLGNRPILVTSGFRTSAHNTEVGGAMLSDHTAGLAADFEVSGLTPFDVYQQLQQAQAQHLVPAFDQLIYYAADNHIHVGLGDRTRGEILLRTTEGSYVQLAGSYVQKIRGYL